MLNLITIKIKYILMKGATEMKKGLAAVGNKPLYKIRRLQLIGYVSIGGLIAEALYIAYLLIR